MAMTPMIDITFLLLIFFVTVSRISDVKQDPTVEVPQTERQPEELERPSTIIVNVTRAGDVTISGRKTAVEQLMEMVNNEMLKLGGDPNRVQIMLRVDRRGTSRTANEVVKRLNDLGVTQVRIAVESGE